MCPWRRTLSFLFGSRRSFLTYAETNCERFSKIEIVLEHLTTAKAVKLVQELSDNVAATITVHHLLITLDDVIGGHLKPHLFCKPLAKRDYDRETLIQAATSGNPKFFLGSDSAPHLLEKKECECGAAGVYTAPVLLPVLAQIFSDHNKLDKLEAFISEYGAKFYGLPVNKDKIELVEKAGVFLKKYMVSYHLWLNRNSIGRLCLPKPDCTESKVQSLKDKPILVTGATGYVGARLVPRLLQVRL